MLAGDVWGGGISPAQEQDKIFSMVQDPQLGVATCKNSQTVWRAGLEEAPTSPSPGHAQFPLVPSGLQLTGKPAGGSLWPVKAGRVRLAGDPAGSLRLGTSGTLLRVCWGAGKALSLDPQRDRRVPGAFAAVPAPGRRSPPETKHKETVWD